MFTPNRAPHAPISQKLFCYFGGAGGGAGRGGRVSKSAHLLKCSTNFLHMNSSVVELTFYNPRFCISRFDNFHFDPPQYFTPALSVLSYMQPFLIPFNHPLFYGRVFVHVILFCRLLFCGRSNLFFKKETHIATNK